MVWLIDWLISILLNSSIGRLSWLIASIMFQMLGPSKEFHTKDPKSKDNKKKKHGPSDDPLSSDSPMDGESEKNVENHDEEEDDRSGYDKPEHKSSLDGPGPSHDAAMDIDVGDRSEARSIVSRDERDTDRDRVTKKREREREREAEKRSVLTLDLLVPVLRDQGYHLGAPPYFVNWNTKSVINYSTFLFYPPLFFNPTLCRTMMEEIFIAAGSFQSPVTTLDFRDNNAVQADTAKRKTQLPPPPHFPL